jgi:hypothetical protein
VPNGVPVRLRSRDGCAFEKGKLDYFALKFGQSIHLALKETAQIGLHELIINPVPDPRIGLALDLRFETLFGPTVCLAATQAIDRPAPRQGYHPAKGPTRSRRIIFRFSQI